MKVLIVEDEPAIADALTFALRTDGFQSAHASTAAEAEQILDQGMDLIILDVGLPDKSGFDFLKEIRTRTRVPVLLLTARSDEVDRVVGLELGADDYVTKPFSPREVTARVKAILRRVNPATTPTPSTATGPAFHIDEEKKVIRFFGTALTLSQYEFKILSLFVRRPGWIYSREKLMELVWDEPEESFDRSVDTHIKNIRSKLKEIKEDLNPIMTRRGIGYGLKENI